MIRLETVTKRYPGGHDALKGLSLSVGRGEMVFVTGHSGAGKSTLLRLIALIDRPTSGQVIVDGKDTRDITRRRIPGYRRQIGMVFQDHKLLYDRPVSDNVALPLIIAGMHHREAERRVRAALEQVLQSAPADGGCPFDLDGRCILYVGGRTNNVCRLRALVQQWNGELLHHDGGLEKSLDELASAVTRADAVVFPTDCISHKAVTKLKLLCRRNMKPFVPLRSTGMSSFVQAVRSGIGSADRAEAGP